MLVSTEAATERLRDEHGYSGGFTVEKDYVLARPVRHREVFVPLRHDPGHAQVDFGEALAEIAGVERKIHFFGWTCRTATPVSSRPIRRRPAKGSVTGSALSSALEASPGAVQG